MKRILLTGISGTGKSTVTMQLAARGYRSVDADSDEYSEWVTVVDDSATPGTPVEPGRDWVWRVDRIQALLFTKDSPVLFLSGCAANMGPLLPLFERVILLTAPAEVIAARLAQRTTNLYGKRPEEVTRVLDLLDSVESLLRHAADHVIDTNAPLDEVIAAVERYVELMA